jgi:hypothetical protein
MATAPTTGEPGQATSGSGYPQYGVSMTSGGQIATANDAEQKADYTTKGYIIWFTSKSAASDFISSQANAGAGDTGAGVVHDVLDTAGALTEAAHWIGDFVTHLTDVHMWISLGWLALGLLLLVAGIVWLLRKSGVLPKTTPVPVPVPV